MSTEEKISEEDHEGDCIELQADLAAVSSIELGNLKMDGDLTTNTEIEEDVPITSQLDTAMNTTVTTHLGEVNDENDVVLQGSLLSIEQVLPTRLTVHHMAPVTSSAQTTITPPTSRSISSCTTPLPRTTPPPTALTMSPGSHSSTPEASSPGT